MFGVVSLRGQSVIPGGSHREAGAPPFVAIGVETLGLTAAPTSMTRMPDGRLLLMAPRQIALGDGARWDVFQQSADDPREGSPNPAIGSDGAIHLATLDGVARVTFRDDGTWQLVPLAAWGDAGGEAITLPQAQVNDLGDHWLWHSLSGPIISWQPDGTPRRLATASVFEHAFRLGDAIYLSERFRGRLSRIDSGDPELILESSTLAAITCSVPFDPGVVLAGTYGTGLQLFDGTSLRPFPAGGPLATGARIQDICATEGGFFAVAIDNYGIAFVARDGRVVQTLDRAIDSRLARARRLVATQDGAIWILLDAGLIRAAFPSQVSNFEWMIGPGVTTAHPRRVDGNLWLLADGRLHRAAYDTTGRLSGLELDSPPHVFVNSFAEAPGMLIAGTEQGAWCRRKDGGTWTLFADDAHNLHILDPQPIDGHWLFVARDEVGWLERTEAGMRIARRNPAPGMANVFNRPIRDARGRYWLELGAGRLARVALEGGAPVVTILDDKHDLPNNWPQAFLFEGGIRVTVGDFVHRFDEERQRFVQDPEFVPRLPGVRQIFGRAPTGPDGRLWVAGDGVVRVFRKHEGAWREDGPPIHAGFLPYYLTFEESGVVWMHTQHRLARFDPAMPVATTPPIVARITEIMVSATNRRFFDPGESLPPLRSEENSLIARFTTRADNFGAPVTFDVALEGGGGDWIHAGSSGSAVLNNLRHGHYVLRVRPVADGIPGAADVLAFTIHPPWYRTVPAYLGGILLVTALITAITRGWSYLERRERRRLAHLVDRRTAELRGSEERYRRLSEELEQRVAERTAELNRANARLTLSNRELESFSYSVSHDLRAPLRGIDGWSLALVEDYGDRLDTTARDYLARVRRETQRLGQLIDDLLSLSRATRAEIHPVALDLSALAAATAARVAETRPGSRVEFICQPDLRTEGDPVLLGAALFNLLDNAWKFTSRTEKPRVEFGRTTTSRGRAFFVGDNGAGFDMRHAGKLFGVFQRMHTQEEFPGSGVGLATVQRIIERHGGQVWAESTPGVKTLFFLLLPDPEE